MLISSLSPIWWCTYIWLFPKKPLHSTHYTYIFKISFSLLTLSTAFLQKASGPGKKGSRVLYHTWRVSCLFHAIITQYTLWLYYNITYGDISRNCYNSSGRRKRFKCSCKVFNILSILECHVPDNNPEVIFKYISNTPCSVRGFHLIY